MAAEGAGGGQVLLRIDKLEVVYHQVLTAVQGITLEARQGQIVALLGNNGAGKTTTLRAISGFIGLDDAKVTEGSIRYKGHAMENQPPHMATGLGIVLVPERDKVFETLTVEENLEITVAGKGAKGEVRNPCDLVFDYFPQLGAIRKRLAGYLSGGERQMLCIGSALACAPELLLVDELSQGLAPLIIEDLMERLRAIRDDMGLTVLLVEQNAEVALEIADYGYVMENGRLVLDGDADRLRGHHDVQEFYLGGSQEEGRRSYRMVKQYRRSRRWYG